MASHGVLMKPVWNFLLPFIGIVGVGGAVLGFSATGAFDEPLGPPEEIDWSLPFEPGDHIRLEGMAHYTATVTQDYPADWFRDAETVHLFGFFEPLDAEGREIKMLVRTPRQPERLVSYELMTIEGVVQPLMPETVPASTETLMGEGGGYWFDDFVVVIEPHTIEAADGTWRADSP